MRAKAKFGEVNRYWILWIQSVIIALVIVLAVAYSYKKHAVGVQRYELNGSKNPLVKNILKNVNYWLSKS